MGNIVLLDDLTINKIAAGEVIERPASVVKEMLENSIDAGAKNITVEIKKGGISLIKITDDGCGISEDDMEIAFERHATSKIRSADDLQTVKSMGFRGEALASIASVAKVEMISKKQNAENAYKIIVEGGKTVEFTETARNVGTTITVENLFYNTPVRYKFLKRDYTEIGYIEDVVTKIALVNRNVAIKLINCDKKDSNNVLIQTNGNGDLKTAIYSIYGKDVATEVIDVDFNYENIKVTGVIGKPVIARGNRSNQLFFLNGRYIKDKNLTAAADQAYKGMIPIGRYGFIVLNIEMDPRLVDVNVHPAKLEVRFEDESLVFKALYHAIKTSLAKSELVENVEKAEEKETINKEIPKVETSVTNQFINEGQDNKKKKGFSNLFKKIMKEPDETDEERNNNHLEEIFKYRQGLKQSNYDVSLSDSSNTTYNDKKIINNDVVDKNILLGNTLVSSDTKQINLENANNVIKDATKELMSTKFTEKQSTQIINVSEIESEINNNVNSTNEKNNDEEENVSFATIAEQLVQSKLGLDNTQMIDTVKVREAIKEDISETTPEFNEMYKKTFGVNPFSVRKELEQEKKEKEKLNASNDFSYANENINVFDSKENEVQQIPYKYLGIAFSTYIIIEIGNELYIIDQHAAHERIMYEKVKDNYYNETEKDEQFLLLPDVITLTHKEMAIANENIEMFNRAGFSFEEFGENTIKLMSVPSMCEDLNTKQLFLDILDEIDTVAVTARQEKEDKFIATIACKAAVKAKMKLKEQEVKSLMKKLLELPNPFTCPHGRPTAIKMTKTDLEKKFSRR